MFYWVTNQKNLKQWFPNSKAYIPDDAQFRRTVSVLLLLCQNSRFFSDSSRAYSCTPTGLIILLPSQFDLCELWHYKESKRDPLSCKQCSLQNNLQPGQCREPWGVLDERGKFFLASTDYFSTVKSYVQVCPLSGSMISFHHVRNNMWITQECFNV